MTPHTHNRQSDCGGEEVCSEHSGIKAILYLLLIGVVANILLLSYNVFGVTAVIKEDMSAIKSDISNIIKANEKLECRVTTLERAIFKAK